MIVVSCTGKVGHPGHLSQTKHCKKSESKKRCVKTINLFDPGLAVRAALAPGLEGVVVFTPPKNRAYKKMKHFFGIESVKKMIGENEKNLIKYFPVKVPHGSIICIDPESL